MRFERTTRGLGCVQVGRLVNGQLGVLGKDQEFDNDGRFHPLPPGVLGAFQCSDLDLDGHAYLATPQASTASAFPDFGCLLAGDPRLKHQRGMPICAVGDPRMLYFGLLGPDAKSVTYAAPGGRLRTIATIGQQGAYLIVTAPTRLASQFTPSFSPTPPIIRITYRDGHSCDTASSTPCPRVGYAPQPLPHPTQRQVASPVRFILNRAKNTISISFTARYPVANIDSAYGWWVTVLSSPSPTGAGGCNPPGADYGGSDPNDVRVGERVHFLAHIGRNCPGRLRIEVYYASERSSPGGLPDYTPPELLPPGPQSATAGVSRTVGSITVTTR